MTQRVLLEKRLAKYGALSAALAAAVSPQRANASSISFAENVTTAASTPLYFDPLTGTTDLTNNSGDLFYFLTDVQDYKTVARLIPEATGAMFAINSKSSVLKLAQGMMVGGNLTFGSLYSTLASNSNAGYGQWNTDPKRGYVGLEFLNNSAQTIYGWADITVNSDYTITLNAVGYEDSGMDSIAGGTPEPSTFVLLTLGFAGLAAYRRRNKNTHPPVPAE